jgi:hypothetical protein
VRPRENRRVALGAHVSFTERDRDGTLATHGLGEDDPVREVA